MSRLKFQLSDGTTITTDVTHLLNGGWAGRDQADVERHIAELAEIGVPAPAVTPTLYPLSNHLAMQVDAIQVQHGKTSAEAEYALVFVGEGPEDVLVTAASDHTDRALEAHGVSPAKQAYPDLFSRQAWRLADVADRWDELVLRCWAVSENGQHATYQDGTLAELLPPDHWLPVLADRGQARPGTVLLSGTIPVASDGLTYARRWGVELHDPFTAQSLPLEYKVDVLPAGIE